jgi:hypothetical protein
MFVHGQRARQLEAVFFAIALLGAGGIACSDRTTGPSPTPGPSATGPVTISPARLEASLSEPVRPEGRYLINPSVTFSAAGTVTMVKEVTFAFVVDADRVIKQGAFLVHGGDLRRGPVTQRYPLTFDVPVHFPNLRVQMRALFIDDSGASATHVAEAAIQLPTARP